MHRVLECDVTLNSIVHWDGVPPLRAKAYVWQDGDGDWRWDRVDLLDGDGDSVSSGFAYGGRLSGKTDLERLAWLIRPMSPQPGEPKDRCKTCVSFIRYDSGRKGICLHPEGPGGDVDRTFGCRYWEVVKDAPEEVKA